MSNHKQFTVCLTHDVDRVRKTYHYLTHDIRKGRWKNLRFPISGRDPYWNFERIMEMEDRHGVRSTWFFLEESIPFQLSRPRSWPLSLGRYSVREKEIADVIRRLEAGGWEVGLHGSFRSYRSAELLKKEKAILEDVLGKPVTGVRQHYLNLEIPSTWRFQREAGFTYDASFGYRRGLGWRRDRIRPFLDRESGMWVVPLAIMEYNLFAEAAGCPERACAVAKELIAQAESRGAVLTVLWHPHLYSEADFPGYAMVYEKIIEEGIRRGAAFRTCREVAGEAADSEDSAPAGPTNSPAVGRSVI